MKKLNVTVNGTTYQVEVEEVGGATAPAARSAAPTAAASAPVATAPAAPAAPAAAAPVQVSAGDTTVNAPMPGKVSKVSVKEGQQVKTGDILMFLEAMKMQNEIAAPVAGTVKTVNVAKGQNVKPGEIMIVIG